MLRDLIRQLTTRLRQPIAPVFAAYINLLRKIPAPLSGIFKDIIDLRTVAAGA